MRPCKRSRSVSTDDGTTPMEIETDDCLNVRRGSKRSIGNTADYQSNIFNEGYEDTSTTGKKQRSAYEIAGIIRTKVLFDQYPRSIMN